MPMGGQHLVPAGYATATARTAYSSDGICAATDGQNVTAVYAAATVPATAVTTDAVAGKCGLYC